MLGRNATKDKPPRPEALAVLPENIPDALKALPQWVVWDFVEDVDPEAGESDWDKPPLDARTRRHASSTDPSTWCDFQTAFDAYRHWDLSGVGFVLHVPEGHQGDMLVAIDLDHCRDPETGVIAQWAWEVVKELNSYTEVSPSGTGLRIFFYGRLPPEGRKRGNYECYDGLTLAGQPGGRYVTVTGRHVSWAPRAIEHRQDALLAFHKRIWPAQPNHEGNGASTSRHNGSRLSDDEIIWKGQRMEGQAGAKFRLLWAGDRRGYNSPSEADLALCNYLAFFCGPGSEERIAELFAQSGLNRSKWKRDDYRKRTIGKALSGRTEFYSVGDGPHLTDQGNARRVVEAHGNDLRFCHPWKSWIVWDGTRWRLDDTAEVVRRVKQAQAAFYKRALADLKPDSKDKKDDALKEFNHALKWEDAKRVANCLDLMRSEPEIPILPADLDADPFLLNVANGTIDLHTGALRTHCREDLITKLAPVAYDHRAACPLWLKFLARIMAGNQRLIAYLQRVVGYCLSGDVSEQCLWFFHGTGANGKSTFLTTILAMLGDYGIQAVSDLLMVKNHESHPTERADLFGRRFVATIETEEGKRLAEALMKQVTGGDKVRARKMRQDFFEFSPTHKIFLAANHKPVVRGCDLAVWRRIKLVPFAVTIPDHEKDKTLPVKLAGELSGILNWAVAGCLDWRRHGLDEPEEVRVATDAYRSESDLLASFIEAVCEVLPQACVKSSALLGAYQDWSGDRWMTPVQFARRMEERGFTSKKSGGCMWWHGIGLPLE
jgi:putative DNA primase/helicase